MTNRTWVAPAVFGTFDGLTSSLGVLLALAGHPHIVLPAAVGVGTAEMVGMAAGQWQSDSNDGPGAAVVIGVSTGAGCVLPAVPFAICSPDVAAAVSTALVLAITAGIARLRADRGRLRAAVESYAVLVAVAAVVLLVHLFTPGGGT